MTRLGRAYARRARGPHFVCYYHFTHPLNPHVLAVSHIMEVSFALTGKGYVIVAADMSAAHSIIKVKTDVDKIKELSPHLLMSFSGEPGMSEHDTQRIQPLIMTRRYCAIRRIRRAKPPPLPHPQHLPPPTPFCRIMDPSVACRLLALSSPILRQSPPRRLRHAHVHTPSLLGRLSRHSGRGAFRSARLWKLFRAQFTRSVRHLGILASPTR